MASDYLFRTITYTRPKLRQVTLFFCSSPEWPSLDAVASHRRRQWPIAAGFSLSTGLTPQSSTCAARGHLLSALRLIPICECVSEFFTRFQQSSWCESRSTIFSSKVGVDFKALCHMFSFVITAKSSWKRARSSAGCRRRTC